jgi:hypothetical protein
VSGWGPLHSRVFSPSHAYGNTGESVLRSGRGGLSTSVHDHDWRRPEPHQPGQSFTREGVLRGR